MTVAYTRRLPVLAYLSNLMRASSGRPKQEVSARTESASPSELIRRAMEVLANAWLDAGRREANGAAPTDVNPRTLVAEALATVSLWTCVQWGVDLQWWSNAPHQPHESRRIGFRRLSGWFGTRQPSAVSKASIATDSELQIWALVAEICRRCRTIDELAASRDAFAHLVSAFENALQIVGELGPENHVVLSFGKANSEHARRRSGSYYTPTQIVEVVLDLTLTRAVRDRSFVNGKVDTVLRVLDPACGAGLFLVAAAKRITHMRLNSEAEGERSDWAAAFATTVKENIFGVDSSPAAVDWCRLWLWSCAGDATIDLEGFAPGLHVGNALLGAPPDYWRGAPPRAWAGAPNHKAETRLLRARHSQALVEHGLSAPPSSVDECKTLADGWCAAFFWSIANDACAAGPSTAPTYGALRGFADVADTALKAQLVALASERQFLHWSLEFEDVFADGGFDVVIGNPPWIAHAGRAAQTLDPALKHYFASNYRAFSGYPSTHGLFVERAVGLLKLGGRLGFVLPSSVSELGGYTAVRAVHDEYCDFECELPDFGEGCFAGVTQPCMSLISRRREGGRTGAPCGSPWPVARGDLSERDVALLARLATLPRLPATLFGERGIQSDPRLKQHLSAGSGPHGRFTTPLREGSDIREFRLGPPRLWADWAALGRHARKATEYETVGFVVRQTASYPIAALSDGLPFRNSLLAGFCSAEWSAGALVALLNSTLIRWHHYMRHRDARQPVLPQVKIAHLRAIPGPPTVRPEQCRELETLSQALSELGEVGEAERAQLDGLVASMYGLSAAEQALLQLWSRSHNVQRKSRVNDTGVLQVSSAVDRDVRSGPPHCTEAQ